MPNRPLSYFPENQKWKKWKEISACVSENSDQVWYQTAFFPSV